MRLLLVSTVVLLFGGNAFGAGQETTVAPSTRTTPSAETATDGLPAEYAPMAASPRFNSNDPSLVREYEQLTRLKVNAPRWVAQFLSFPSPSEIKNALGQPPAQVRQKALESIRQMLASRFLPEELSAHLIPLSSWAVLYEDWRDHGKTDVFLTRYSVDNYLVQVAETPNHIVVFVRDTNGKPAEERATALRQVYAYANLMLNEHLKPVSAESLEMFQANSIPFFLYGYYLPKLDVLTGNTRKSDLLTSNGLPNESSSSARASAVRFYTDGDFAAFLLPKPVLNGELLNPFEPRFEAHQESAPSSLPTAATGSEKQVKGVEALAANQAQFANMAEYLGDHFCDPYWRQLNERVPLGDIEQTFRGLSYEQKLMILERLQSDEYYTSGTRAFLDKDYDSALIYWTRLVRQEPENSRGALLLQLAIKYKTRDSFAGNLNQARGDKLIAQGMDALFWQQKRLVARMEQKRQERVRNEAVDGFRARALEFMKEGNYSESLKQWERILDIEPGNATALFFKDICEGKLKGRAKLK